MYILNQSHYKEVAQHSMVTVKSERGDFNLCC